MWPTHRTKIVCTLGPASASRDVIAGLIESGMNIARLNFSHADLPSHGLMIDAVRDVARSTGRHVAILADLPGPKIRLGELARPIDLAINDELTLTTDAVVGDARRVPVGFAQLPQVVLPGDAIYINDGFVQLEVESVRGHDVRCRVVMGGEIRSRKGVNLPGTKVSLTAFTDRDRESLRFALERGVDAVSQSFVETRSDIDAVRAAAAELGHEDIFVIAKIERERALAHIDGILDAADGIMIARGDLGVETAIERIAIVQKQLARLANQRGKPVITATQMLESMPHSPRPTRAEATDVANAILDGTDCVMLSGESAIGTFPIEAVAMLARIAAVTEPLREAAASKDSARDELRGAHTLVDLISSAAANTAHRIRPTAVFVPTETGASARSVSRFSIPAWIVAITLRASTTHRLLFSYGIFPVHLAEAPDDWSTFVRAWLHAHDVADGVVVITGGPSPLHQTVNHRLELIDLGGTAVRGSSSGLTCPKGSATPDRCPGMMLAAPPIMETSPIRRILVPVDFSESSRTALRFANALARSLGATVEVVHVIERPYESPAVASEDELAEVQPKLGDFVASIGDDVVDAQHVEAGPVHQLIVSIADAKRFDLIVMGTAGRTGRPRSMAGSVAESVVRTAGCPVLTIREYPSSRV